MQEKFIDPITIIESVHAQHAALCDTLEEIADSLPGAVDASQCASEIHILSRELPLHHKDEEEGLFLLLRKRAKKGSSIEDHLEQLTQEHATDESSAFDIAETLEQLAHGETPENPNMIGYMLRSFFENYRRHLHWENTVLLPMARKFLTKTDLNTLSTIMAGHRSPVVKSSKTCNDDYTVSTAKKPH